MVQALPATDGMLGRGIVRRLAAWFAWICFLLLLGWGATNRTFAESPALNLGTKCPCPPVECWDRSVPCPANQVPTRPDTSDNRGRGTTEGQPPGQQQVPYDSFTEPQSPLAGLEGSSQGPGNLPSGLGAVAASRSPSVNMIGDYFGSGYFLGGTDGFATAPVAGGDRRFKATDNFSPLPQDRVFFNYHHFHNAVSDINGVDQDVNRYTFGLERTFLNNIFSLEFRLPFAGGLESDQSEFLNDTEATEFGNITFTLKSLLWNRGPWNVTGGMATVVPTARDASVEGDGTFTLMENNAVHLQPFLGIYRSDPCSRLFSTAYVAVDVDVNGNAIYTGPTFSTPPLMLTPLGDVRDQTLIFFDWQLGYWWYRDYGHIGYLNGIAPILEVHYTQALEDPVNLSVYQNPFGKVSLVNMTGGLLFDFRKTASLIIYGAAPLNREESELFGRTVSPVFQAEVGLQCIYRY